MTDKEIPDQVIQVVLTLPDRELAGLSVTKLARILKVDRFKLSRQFKRQKDMTLECFIFKEKMTRAAFLLMGRSIAVKEVARRLGFCTCDYFIRKFREYYGIVPGQFREFRIRRSGEKERRSGLKDRRKKLDRSKIPGGRDRRKGVKDRRKEPKDRRKQEQA
ncbi:MAG: helix-turn-helix domain-containing protein, partial [Candidatus Aminicenantes bacterium]|nr:helix-turn-helix domain-containing protein [Candidatus Aminicenantes bacterium]NIM83042.1 helix-turn-helix domain-containing protein [Candidatus Aminicenantes bacterium]NIN19570.1 helix-turn-helix domain-containing protein [Candidatus Aminicenantes bacterium]NIN40732.1 helix-turn-helix domain-containing protein [Candidatus Aminicenantes bacterium]NIN83541.1 helix-turn-helix domain-containing protein [Candidatus Aminicenantes bacterium]